MLSGCGSFERDSLTSARWMGDSTGNTKTPVLRIGQCARHHSYILVYKVTAVSLTVSKVVWFGGGREVMKVCVYERMCLWMDECIHLSVFPFTWALETTYKKEDFFIHLKRIGVKCLFENGSKTIIWLVTSLTALSCGVTVPSSTPKDMSFPKSYILLSEVRWMLMWSLRFSVQQ